MKRLAIYLSMLVLVTLSPRAVAAQSLPLRADVRRLRDSLAALTDSALLGRVPVDPAHDCMAPGITQLSGLRAVLAQERLGELTGRERELRRALACWTNVVETAPAWSVAWAGLGHVRLTLARQHAIAHPGPLQPLGSSYARGAAEAFMRALALDSTCTSAALELPQAVDLMPAWVPYTQARDALRRTVNTAAGRHPEVLLARARYERRAGQRDSTLVLLQRYIAAGGDSAVGELELAREFYARGDITSGEAAYATGAATAGRTAMGRAAYRANLGWIASPTELATFDSLPAGSVESWILRFWSRRDAATGRRAGRRLAEHFRRYEYAVKNFGVITRRSAGAPSLQMVTADVPTGVDTSRTALLDRLFGDTLGGSTLLAWPTLPNEQQLDARGRVYIRYGPPDNRAGRWWAYYRSNGDLYLPVVPGNAALPGGRCDLNPRFCFTPTLALRKRWAKEQTRMTERALTTDEYLVNYRHTVRPVVQVYAITDSASRASKLLAVFALSSNGLEPIARDSGSSPVMYPIHFRLTAAVPSGARRFDTDTLRRFILDQPLTGQQHLAGMLELSLVPGRYNVRLTVEEPESGGTRPAGYDPEQAGARGAVIGLDSIRVPAMQGDSLMMSDVILGREGSGLVWVAPDGAAVPLNPLNAYPPGGTMALYYQVIGQIPGTEYETTIALARADDDKGRRVVRLRSTARATRHWTAVRRRLDLPRLKAGHYRLTVTVKQKGAAANLPTVSRSGIVNVVSE